MGIESMAPMSGREIKEDGTAMNVADILDDSPIDIVLQNAALAASTGTEINISHEKNLTLFITNPGGATIIFQGADSTGTYYTIADCYNRTANAVAGQTTGTGEVWSIDLSGFTKFRANVTTAPSQAVTVRGRLL